MAAASTDPVTAKTEGFVEEGEAEEKAVEIRNITTKKNQWRTKERTATAVVSEVFDFLSQNPSANLDDIEDLEATAEQDDHLYSNVDVADKKFPSAEKLMDGFHTKDSGFASLERQISEKSATVYDNFIGTEVGADVGDAKDDTNVTSVINYVNRFVDSSNGEESGMPAYTRNEDSVYDDVDIPIAPDNSNSEIDLTSAYFSSEKGNALVASADRHTRNSTADASLSAEEKADFAHTHQAQPSQASVCPGIEPQMTIINLDTKERTTTSASQQTQEKLPLQSGIQNCAQSSPSAEYVINMNEQLRDATNSPSIVKMDCISDNENSNFVEDNVYDTVIRSETNDNNENALNSGPSGEREKSSLPRRYSGEIYYSRGAANESVSSDDDDDDIDSSEAVTAGSRTASASDQAYDTIDNEEEEQVGKVTETKNDSSENATDTAFAPLVKSPLDLTSANSSSSPLSDANDTVGSDSKDTEILPLESPTASDKLQSINEEATAQVSRRPKLEQNPSVELGSEDSSDEDIGIYAESFRRSNWIRVSKEGKLEIKMNSPSSRSSSKSLQSSSSSSSAPQTAGSSVTDSTDGDVTLSPKADEVFNDPLSQAAAEAKLLHKRSDSTATTASENEFKKHYVSRRKCLIQRADSQQEYHRLSSRMYDQDKQVVVERLSDCDDLGLHILDSHPAFITSVDPGSAADKAGITEGQIIVTVNDQNVLFTDHADLVELIQNSKGSVKLGVANSDFQPVRDLQAAIMSGYMSKLGNSSFMKIWKKRYFVLRQDNCLYYYKNDQELDPLGALPLNGYTISRHTDTNKDFCFKAEKYRARTYFFMTESRDQLTQWVGALTEAVARSKKRKESFLSVSSHNVGLPALDIRKPECTGFLGKLSPGRVWRRRYCVLKDACIYYYKEMNSLNALGVAHLHGYTVDVESHPRRKFSFSLQPPEKKMRIFYFSADNDTDKKRWVESLIHSIQRWVRVDREAEC